MKDLKLTACVFLYKDGRVFIAKRANTKEFLPGKFELPGGHIEDGETPQEGLRREFQEEFGIEIKVGEKIYTFTYLNKNDQVAEEVYFAQLVNPKAEIKLNLVDHSEYRWVERKEIDGVWDKNDEEYKAIQKGFDVL